MPQRHHQGHKRTPKQLALIIKRCLPMVLTGSGMLCTTANAEEYYFDPIMLETTKSGMQTTDLSRFSKKYAQLPGTYQVDIWLNKKKVSQKKITFTANAEQLLQPQFTVEQLRELGIKVDEIPALAEKDDDSVINSLEQIIPGTAAEFDFNHQRLNLSIPQIALYRDARGYVSPSRWDDGIPTLFTNYSFTGSDNRYRQGNRSQRQYLNMQNGANFGPWRLRNYSTWTRNDQASSWNTISSYLQRDIKALKSQLLLGESATSGSIFSSYTFTGVQLASDDNMLPNSQRGFAPTVRGIANSSAIVTIRQNGYVIYQSNVPAGAFEINDLYPSSNNGDLEVTIEESDGTQRRFIQPYSSLPMMQRPRHLKYSATAGRYRADANSDSKEPEFAEATAIYGLNNTFTLYGGRSVLKIIMRWGSVSAAHLAHWARCRWISTELTPNSITSTLFMAINGVRSTSKISRKPTPISLSATIAIPTMAILVLMKPIPAIGTITVAKKVKFNSTSARQYLMG